jgi:hypothetical protein
MKCHSMDNVTYGLWFGKLCNTVNSPESVTVNLVPSHLRIKNYCLYLFHINYLRPVKALFSDNLIFMLPLF